MTQRIANLLAAAAGDRAEVFFAHPANWAKAPCLSYRETGNRTHARADGREFLREIEYTVDIWSGSAEEMREIAQAVDGAMLGAGFRRVQALDLFEEKVRYLRRTARYRALTDGERIYQ